MSELPLVHFFPATAMTEGIRLTPQGWRLVGRHALPRFRLASEGEVESFMPYTKRNEAL